MNLNSEGDSSKAEGWTKNRQTVSYQFQKLNY